MVSAAWLRALSTLGAASAAWIAGPACRWLALCVSTR
jgi:hypothetical protein